MPTVGRAFVLDGNAARQVGGHLAKRVELPVFENVAPGRRSPVQQRAWQQAESLVLTNLTDR